MHTIKLLYWLFKSNFYANYYADEPDRAEFWKNFHNFVNKEVDLRIEEDEGHPILWLLAVLVICPVAIAECIIRVILGGIKNTILH